MSPNGFEFSVSPYTTVHLDFDQYVALYRSLGIETIELIEGTLSTDPGKASEQLAHLRDSGLTVGSVVPRVHSLFPDTLNPEAGGPRQRAASFQRSIEFLAEHLTERSVPFVTVSGAAPGLNFAEATRTALEVYPELARCAAEHDFKIAFEPLSPVMMNTDTFVCTLDRAARLVDRVGDEAFGLTLDVWHVWDEPDLAPRIEALGDRLFLVHHADWPAAEPREFADRLIPGDGVIDFRPILGAIDRAGYRGPHVLEIFSADHLTGSLWKRDPAEVIALSRDALNEAWINRI